MLRRLTAALAASALVPLRRSPSPSGGAEAAPHRDHRDRYQATIAITKHGIPHVTADDFGSLGFERVRRRGTPSAPWPTPW